MNKEIWEATQDERAISVRAFVLRVRDDEDFRERYEVAFPENAIHVVALMSNPRCDCLGKMIQNHMTNQDKLKEAFPEVMGEDATLILPRSLIGEAVNIPYGKYKEFIHCLGKFGWQYRGLSVMDAETQLRIFFY